MTPLVRKATDSAWYKLKLFFWGYELAMLFLAVIYGLVLAGLPMDVFLDRANYLIYAQESGVMLAGRSAEGWIPTLTNEPLWLLGNLALGLMLEPYQVVQVLILIPATLVAFFVLRTNPRQFGWLLMFLFLPYVIKNHIIQLRQGVAIAIFLIGWQMQNRVGRRSVFLLTPLVHSSFFFVLGLLALIMLVRKLRFGMKLRILLFLVTGLGIGLSLSWFSQTLGARQGDEYLFVADKISGLGFLFWAIVLAMFCIQGKAFMREHAFSAGTITFYLSTYFLVEVTARIFESTLIIVLLSGLKLNKECRLLFLLMITIYGLLSYMQRFNQPLLGFGI